MPYPTNDELVPLVLARWEKARYLKTTDGYYNTDLDTLNHYARAHEDIRVLARRIATLEAERDDLRAALEAERDELKTGLSYTRAQYSHALDSLKHIYEGAAGNAGLCMNCESIAEVALYAIPENEDNSDDVTATENTPRIPAQEGKDDGR